MVQAVLEEAAVGVSLGQLAGEVPVEAGEGLDGLSLARVVDGTTEWLMIHDDVGL